MTIRHNVIYTYWSTYYDARVRASRWLDRSYRLTERGAQRILNQLDLGDGRPCHVVAIETFVLR